jgi:hypothetical protein
MSLEDPGWLLKSKPQESEDSTIHTFDHPHSFIINQIIKSSIITPFQLTFQAFISVGTKQRDLFGCDVDDYVHLDASVGRMSQELGRQTHFGMDFLDILI